MIWLTFQMQSTIHPQLNTTEKKQFYGSIPNNVAVCVTGQVGRLQPEYLYQALLHENPNYIFKFFYILQNGSSIFNTGVGFSDTKYNSLTISQIESKLSDLLNSTSSSVEEVSFSTPMSFGEWTKKMRGHKLDRMNQYTYAQNTILNMYNKQVQCANSILKYEMNRNVKFKLIVNTREDAFFFNPLNFTMLHEEHLKRNHCDVVMKDCLNWGGVNMRFQLYGRAKGLEILSRRITFYESMFSRNLSVLNPEVFEQLQMDIFDLKVCPLSIELVPATAVRFKVATSANVNYCFNNFEIGDCHPESWNKTFLLSRMC